MNRLVTWGAASAAIWLSTVPASAQVEPPIQGPAAQRPKVDVLQIFDDFEEDEVGAAPKAGWLMRFNAADDPEHNRVVDTVAVSGKKSLQVYGAHGGKWAAAVSHALPPWKEPYLVSCMVRPGNESGSGWNIEANVVLVREFEGVHAWPGGVVAFLTDKTISPRWLSNVSFSKTETWTPNEWYAVAIGVVPEHRRLFFLLNGRYIGCRDVPEKEWPEDGFDLSLDSGDGIAWYDDVWARVVPQAGPYLEPLAFLTGEIGRVLAERRLVPGPAVPFDITPAGVLALFADGYEPPPVGLRSQLDRLRAEKKWIGAFGPVRLKVTDPQGRSLSAEKADIPKGVYLVEDLNGDGKKEVTVLLDAEAMTYGSYGVEATNGDAQKAAKFSVFYYDPAAEKLTPLAVDEELKPGQSRRYSVNIERTGARREER
jgi:hypothetical protein